MNIGEIVRTHRSVPAPQPTERPVRIIPHNPEEEPVFIPPEERPIPVPDWPVKVPEKVESA